MPAKKQMSGDVVELIKIHRFFLKDLPEITAYLDTGYGKQETIALIRKLYPNVDFRIKPLVLCLFKKCYVSQVKKAANKYKKLKFSSNWNNKLDCKVFTSIRLDSNKYEVGELYHIVRG